MQLISTYDDVGHTDLLDLQKSRTSRHKYTWHLLPEKELRAQKKTFEKMSTGFLTSLAFHVQSTNTSNCNNYIISTKESNISIEEDDRPLT